MVSVLATGFLLAGCTSTVSGHGAAGSPKLGTAPQSATVAHGGSNAGLDGEVTVALAAVTKFWRGEYPARAGGAALVPLAGGVWAVDGAQLVRTHIVPRTVSAERCLRQDPAAVIDNAFYCPLDDSIVWDDSPHHLLSVLAERYGQATVTLIIAHEFSHAIQQRLGLMPGDATSIQRETEADCGAGAFAAYALAGKAGPEVGTTIPSLDTALQGFVLLRDPTPTTSAGISHGDGFDRLNAVQTGMRLGASYCFDYTYFDRQRYTERPAVTDADHRPRPPRSLPGVLTTVPVDLDRYWRLTAGDLRKRFAAPTLVEEAQPRCGAAHVSDQFGYCPTNNQIYYTAEFAQRTYQSATVIEADPATGDLTFVASQPADFALGVLLAIGWGMAARYQLDGAPIADANALLSAICTAGAYAADINIAQPSTFHPFVLSPQEMDQATSAIADLTSTAPGLSARHTTSQDRIQEFVNGYADGALGC